MLRLNLNEAAKWTPTQRAQFARNNEMRKASLDTFVQIAHNAGLSPQEAYRYMDEQSVVALNDLGEFATYQIVSANSRSVNLGFKEYAYRSLSKQSGGKTSMSGQTGITTDNVDVKYKHTPIPIHDHGTERDWRDLLTVGAEGFDILSADSREAELVTWRQANAYLWDGDNSVMGPSNVPWKGIKRDTSLVQTTTAIDFSSTALTGKEIVDEVAAKLNLLRITNLCSGQIDIGVPSITLSYWAREPYSENYNAGSILNMIKASLPGVKSVYEESRLTDGKELYMGYHSFDGMHAVTGQAMSSYLKQRLMHNDPTIMIKWLAQGFCSKQDYNGKKCALYCKSA